MLIHYSSSYLFPCVFLCVSYTFWYISLQSCSDGFLWDSSAALVHTDKSAWSTTPGTAGVTSARTWSTTTGAAGVTSVDEQLATEASSATTAKDLGVSGVPNVALAEPLWKEQLIAMKHAGIRTASTLQNWHTARSAFDVKIQYIHHEKYTFSQSNWAVVPDIQHFCSQFQQHSIVCGTDHSTAVVLLLSVCMTIWNYFTRPGR